ncbi:hypothetical protein AMECASPLE_023577 [Ameca splendens]|uniref:Uncharacterized protein n=1 Tax=Ameca splendens TaxID=208324 RepID=A0ABV0XT73_9TELE
MLRDAVSPAGRHFSPRLLFMVKKGPLEETGPAKFCSPPRTSLQNILSGRPSASWRPCDLILEDPFIIVEH